MYKLIDGKKLAHKMRAGIKEQVAKYKAESGREIGLAVVLVGEEPASQVYVRNKIKACEEVGIKSYAYYLEKTTQQGRVEELIRSLAVDDKINGILVQLPLPEGLDAKKILSLIPRTKDVDGFSAENIGSLCMNEDCLVACTPNGVMKMFESENIQLAGKDAVVIGRSNIVGKPMAMLLTNANATVTLCHSKTRDLKSKCLNADIVIDVGMDRDESGKLCGDVDFENVKDKCSYITPVPGGVGPMTITMLMYNTYLSAVRS